MPNTTTATVHVAHSASGFQQGCMQCRQMKRKGNYVVILIVDRQQYYIGEEVTPQCCGVPKDGWFSLYSSKEEAEREAARVDAVIARDGHLENLRLIQPTLLARSPSADDN